MADEGRILDLGNSCFGAVCLRNYVVMSGTYVDHPTGDGSI
jgi:hypothetical protein